MGAAIWWAPTGLGALRKLSLSSPLSDMQVRELRPRVVAQSATGQRRITYFAPTTQVRITYEGVQETDELRELEAIANHLERGLSISLAEDEDEPVVAGFIQTRPAQGGTTLVLEDLFGAYAGSSTTFSAGDELEIITAPPVHQVEVCEVSLHSGNLVTLSDGVRHDYVDEPSWVFARSVQFWPILRQAQEGMNAQHLLHRHRLSFTLDLMLEVPSSALGYLVEYDGEIGTDSSRGFGNTLAAFESNRRNEEAQSGARGAGGLEFGLGRVS